MNAQSENQASPLDSVKLLLAAAFIIGGMVGFYLLAAQPLWVRLLVMLAAAGAGVFVAVQTAVGRSVWRFAIDSRAEVRKVVWPSRQETLQTSLFIFVVVLLMSLFLWAVDSVLFWVMKELVG